MVGKLLEPSMIRAVTKALEFLLATDLEPRSVYVRRKQKDNDTERTSWLNYNSFPYLLNANIWQPQRLNDGIVNRVVCCI